MARIIPYEELINSVGSGWVENRFVNKCEDEPPVMYCLDRIVWIEAHYLDESGGEYQPGEFYREGYNKFYGINDMDDDDDSIGSYRVWDSKPTAEERFAARWE